MDHEYLHLANTVNMQRAVAIAQEVFPRQQGQWAMLAALHVGARQANCCPVTRYYLLQHADAAMGQRVSADTFSATAQQVVDGFAAMLRALA